MAVALTMAAAAFVLTLVLGYPYVAFLRRAGLGKQVRSGVGPRVVPGRREPVTVGWLSVPLACIAIMATAHAVNLTGGLDGLAGHTAAVACVAYGTIAFLQGRIYLVTFCFTVAGALLAFLWFNAHPAEVIMGDTGALALGATLAVVALMLGQVLLLPIIGFIFVAVTVSVILQV